MLAQLGKAFGQVGADVVFTRPGRFLLSIRSRLASATAQGLPDAVVAMVELAAPFIKHLGHPAADHHAAWM
jgi:hypothetical protein